MVVIRKLQPLVKIQMPEKEPEGPPRVRRQFLVEVRRRRDYPSPTPQDTPCVLWQGALDRHGYGKRWQYRKSGQRVRLGMHRWIMEQYLGRELKPEEFVLHACDQPLCYRLSHLSVGTIQDNNADMVRKGRNKPPPVNRMVGEKNHNTKLTARDKEKIREEFQQGLRPATLAKNYDVHVGTIRKVLKGTPYPPPPPTIYEIIEKEKRNGN